jgi:hypothetical protein
MRNECCHTLHYALTMPAPLSLRTCCTLPCYVFPTTPQHETHGALPTESTLAMLSSQLLPPQQQEQVQQQHSSSQTTPG